MRDQKIAPDFLDAYQTLSQSAGGEGGNVIIEMGGQRREFRASPEIIQGLTQGVASAALNSVIHEDGLAGRIYEDKLTDLGLSTEDVSALVAHQDGGGQRWFSSHDLMGVLSQRQQGVAGA